jgi:predicted HTH domain antitoxin
MKEKLQASTKAALSVRDKSSKRRASEIGGICHPNAAPIWNFPWPQCCMDGIFRSCYAPAMSVTLDLPRDIEERLRQENPNLDADAREAYAVELFRQGKLNHFQLSRVLGVDRFETDAVLKRHQVEAQSLTSADLEADWVTLRAVLDEAPR